MQIILFSILAGICGTGLGGLITVLFGRSKDKNICIFLSFAGGIMTGIVCFGLIPESLHVGNMATLVVGLSIGILVIMFLNRVVDNIADMRSKNLLLHETPMELYHEENLLRSVSRQNMLRSGIIMLMAIGLHNIPEGLAIGSGSVRNPELGALLTLMIAFHNIPEGMAIAAPLMAGGIKKSTVVILTMLSGAPTMLGALCGIFFGAMSDAAMAMCLAAAGGAMLYVVFGEIIPQAVTMGKDRSTTIFTMIGIIVALFLTLS